MWKTTSRGVTTRIRVIPFVSHLQRNVATTSKVSTQASGATPGQQQKPQPSMKQPLPPKPKRSGGGGKLLGLGLVAGTVGVVGYAWYNEEFRSKFADSVPYSKDFFNALFVYLPDSPSVPAPILSERKKKPEDIQEPSKLRVKKSELTALPPPPSTAAAPSSAAPGSKTDTTAQKTEEPKKEPEPPPQSETSAQRKEREKLEALRRQREKEREITEENAALEVTLEKCMAQCTDLIDQAKQMADDIVRTTKAHTEALKTAMDDSKMLEKENQWQTVSMAFDAREEATRAAETVLEQASDDLEKLRNAIEEGRNSAATKKNKTLITSKEKLNKLTAELAKKKNEIAKAESESRVMSKYKDLVNKGKEQFKKELESIMPEVKIGKGSKLSEDELNALIAHAHRRIDQLRRQLAEQVAMEQHRIQESLENQRMEDEKLAQFRIRQEKQAVRDELAVEKDKWEADAQVQFEIELRRQLARQTAAHSDHLQNVLMVQEQKLQHQFEREMHVKMLAERERFDTEVSGWVARLRGIEAAVGARAESEKVAQQAQELWLACVALNGGIRVGNESGNTWEEQLKPLEAEVNAVFEAARKNPFVNLVLESIPEKALTRGVYTEENLRERFVKVRRVAKRVALIDETGGSLAKYFLSYMQSLFTFSSLNASSQVDEIDLNELDTLKILEHANYWMAKGDLEQMLGFMNLLRGEPRSVAKDWIEEARLHLEAKQAAISLMAFASATGLGTIF